jgi:hypothetical protein
METLDMRTQKDNEELEMLTMFRSIYETWSALRDYRQKKTKELQVFFLLPAFAFLILL